MYRLDRAEAVEVLLVHPGGPFNVNKDLGAWSIPKGEFDVGEEILQTARREFYEELGSHIHGEFILLKPVRQKGGKTVHAYAVEGNFDTSDITSNTFRQEWPPHSGTMQDFPEIDRAEWFDLAEASTKINQAQTAFLDQLADFLK